MTDPLATLPASVRAKLDGLRDTLISTLGADLRALIVYGSAVRGGYVEGRSDVDLLVVVGNDERGKLEAIGNALLVARTSARIESMILHADELAGAADVFPLLYDDVRSCHVALHGSDPFASLEIADTHRRLRVEQELREARIRLRLIVSEAPVLPRALPGAVTRKLKQLRSPLHALLCLRGGPDAQREGAKPDHALASVLRQSCALYELDPAPLLDVEKDPGAAYDRLRSLLDAAIADIDAMAV